MAERLAVSYEPMRCRGCQQLIEPDLPLSARLGRRLTLSSRKDCIYRCDCGVSYSNAPDAATEF